MGFAQGFQMGSGIVNDAVRNAMEQERLDLAKASDARAAKEFDLRMADQARRDAAFDNYSNLAGGLDTSSQQQIKNTYGMNPSQIAAGLAGGGQAGLQAKLASYDTPDSYDLQQAPAAGLQRMSADQLKFAAPSRMDKERGMEQLAIAMRDPRAMRESQTAQLDIQKNDIASKVMNMSKADLEKMAPDINQSGYPLLYTGKSKNGYTFLKTEADGKTPIAGSQFTLNESQLRQMAMSHELGSAGFGTEALQTLAAAHKDIGDHVGKWNEAMGKMATTNNTATHFGNQDAAEAMKAQYYKERGAMDRMGAAQYFNGADGNTYAAIPTMGKRGLEFQTVQVNPQGIKLSKPGTDGMGLKPVDVKEEGTKVMMGGRLMFADGMGGYIPAGPTGQPAGYLPSQRSGVLKQSGIPDNLQGRLQWSADGTGIRLGNREYDPRNSEDMKHLIKDANDYDIMTKRIEESNRARMNPPREGGLAFGPKITYRPDPDMPPMYTATDADWAAYRAKQNSR